MFKGSVEYVYKKQALQGVKQCQNYTNGPKKAQNARWVAKFFKNRQKFLLINKLNRLKFLRQKFSTIKTYKTLFNLFPITTLKLL